MAYCMKRAFGHRVRSLLGCDISEQVGRKMAKDVFLNFQLDNRTEGRISQKGIIPVGRPVDHSRDNLWEIEKHYPGRKFTMNTSLQLGFQCIEAIQELHSSSFIHRDIKPANFCHGLKADLHKIYLLDYGLVRRYRTKGGQIRKERKFAPFRGTIKYASVNALLNIDCGRIDDIYSWRQLEKNTTFGSFIDMLVKNPSTSKVKPTTTTTPPTKNVVEPFDWEEGGFYFNYVRPKSTEIMVLGAGTEAVKDEALKSAADEKTTIIEGAVSNTPKSAG
uniref:Protein kinase domain-containing protein n=1 Tax=Romanomermis culicivorax TaxID=13658 RepID=A0A915HFU3_ROMCU